MNQIILHASLLNLITFNQQIKYIHMEQTTISLTYINILNKLTD
jgi:hypothetical protein